MILTGLFLLSSTVKFVVTPSHAFVYTNLFPHQRVTSHCQNAYTDTTHSVLQIGRGPHCLLTGRTAKLDLTGAEQSQPLGSITVANFLVISSQNCHQYSTPAGVANTLHYTTWWRLRLPPLHYGDVAL